MTTHALDRDWQNEGVGPQDGRGDALGSAHARRSSSRRRSDGDARPRRDRRRRDAGPRRDGDRARAERRGRDGRRAASRDGGGPPPPRRRRRARDRADRGDDVARTRGDPRALRAAADAAPHAPPSLPRLRREPRGARPVEEEEVGGDALRHLRREGSRRDGPARGCGGGADLGARGASRRSCASSSRCPLADALQYFTDEEIARAGRSNSSGAS
jgi:hypothetical protein